MDPVAFVLGVVLGFVGSIPAAGPLLFLVIASGVEGRPRRALALGAGGALAESTYVALAFWGFAGLLQRHAELVSGLRLVSGALLIVLGALMLLPRRSRAAPKREAVRGFATGFVLVGTNPAFLLTWSAVAAVAYGHGWLALDAGRVPWLAAGSFAGVVLWFALVAALARRYRERFRRELLERLVRGLGVGLVAFGVWVLTSVAR